jgi:hypothetical protein
MNYQIEIFIYWLFITGVLAVFCYIGQKFTKKKILSSEYKYNCSHRMMNAHIEGVWGVILAITLGLVTYAVIFPTPLSAPTVRITANGDIVPLPYGAWAWEIPEGESYFRRKKTFWCDHTVTGRTKDGIRIQSDTITLTYEITDYAVFFKNYKTGYGTFCKEASGIVFSEAFSDTKIYLNSAENIASENEKKNFFRKRIADILDGKLRDKGMIVVRK